MATISLYIWAPTHHFQQCGILKDVDTDVPVQPPFNLRNSKWCSVSSLTLLEYSSDWLAKALIRLHVCAGWSEALLVPHTTLLEISCHSSYGFILWIKSVVSDQLASSEASWSGSTLFSKEGSEFWKSYVCLLGQIWALSRENLSSGVCEQHRRRPACADWSAPLLFTFWKVSYLDLIRAKFRFSS